MWTFINDETGLADQKGLQLTLAYNEATKGNNSIDADSLYQKEMEAALKGKNYNTGEEVSVIQALGIYAGALQNEMGIGFGGGRGRGGKPTGNSVPPGANGFSAGGSGVNHHGTQNNQNTKGTGQIDDIAKEPFLPDEYYKNNYAPMQGTPGARVDFSRLGSSGQIEKSRVIYDQAGKQKYRIDYSDHGNSAHHTNPHMHEYVYQDAGKSVKSEIKYFMDFSTGRLRQGVIDEATNTIKFID
ncbi:hypothetical protein [Paenibacillus jiagnxiensis]|uniref:hypothetical protein n=1 Tax=Paenibacillus jiagnxiensis TaxID=3228926 RepID=UPI0033B04D50